MMMRYHYVPVRTEEKKTVTVPNFAQDTENLDFLYVASETVKCYKRSGKQ